MEIYFDHIRVFQHFELNSVFRFYTHTSLPFNLHFLSRLVWFFFLTWKFPLSLFCSFTIRLGAAYSSPPHTDMVCLALGFREFQIFSCLRVGIMMIYEFIYMSWVDNLWWNFYFFFDILPSRSFSRSCRCRFIFVFCWLALRDWKIHIHSIFFPPPLPLSYFPNLNFQFPFLISDRSSRSFNGNSKLKLIVSTRFSCILIFQLICISPNRIVNELLFFGFFDCCCCWFSSVVFSSLIASWLEKKYLEIPPEFKVKLIRWRLCTLS